ncbi:MAG: phage tail tip lysozyme [Fusicatenibacter saccharivorans]
MLERLKTSDSVEDAATAFLREYEKCKDLDREEIERVSAAKQIYEVFQEYQSPVE